MCRSCIVRAKTIATTNYDRSIFGTIKYVFNIEIERFACSTRFFSTVEHSDAFSRFRKRSQEVFSREWTIEVNSNETDFFALCCEVINNFTDSFCHRTHSDDYAFSIFSTIVIEQTIFATCDFRDFVHILLNDSRHSSIEAVRSLTVLEEYVRVFSHTTSHWAFRSQCARTECSESILVDKTSEVFILKHFNFLYFVRSTETIEEVDERHTAFDSREVSHSSEVHNFLHRTFSQHSKTSLTASHHVLVVTKNR